MKFPQYQDRAASEMALGLTWACSKLHLEQWDVALFFDRLSGDPDLESTLLDSEKGANVFVAKELNAAIAISSSGCERNGVDPLSVLFHEVAHIVTDVVDYLGDGGVYDEIHELLTNRIECLLYELWQHEQTPKRSD